MSMQPNLRYPDTKPGMTLDHFKEWTIVQLRKYLSDRCINKTGDKLRLVKNVYGAYQMGLPVISTDAKMEMEELKLDYKQKLSLEGGLLNLPDPKHLTDCWVVAPANIPDTTHDDVMDYLRVQNAISCGATSRAILAWRSAAI